MTMADPDESFAELTFDDFVSRAYLPQARLRKGSWRLDERLARNVLSPAFGQECLCALTEAQIRIWLDELLRQGYKISSCNRYLSLLKSIFSCADALGALGEKSSPCRGIAPLKGTQHPPRFLTEAEACSLMKELSENSGLKAKAIQLLLITGAKKSEILRSRWEKLDLERSFLETRDGRRIVLSDSAAGIFKSLPRGSEWCFPGRDGKRPIRDLGDAWIRLRKKLGLDDVRLFDLRHSFANFLAKSGSPPREIQEMLGVSTPRMVMRYAGYGAGPRAAANRIADLIRA